MIDHIRDPPPKPLNNADTLAAVVKLMRAVVLIVGGVFVMPGIASAHSRLVAPSPRSEDDFLMEGPCGGALPTGDPTTYQAGEIIEMEWAVSQNHFNVFQIAFSPHDDLGFDDNVIGVLPDEPDVSEYVQEVPLPMCTCEGCTLQLTQFTATGKLGYYSCADIALVASPGQDVSPCPRVEVPDTATDSDTDSDSDTDGDGDSDTTAVTETNSDDTMGDDGGDTEDSAGTANASTSGPEPDAETTSGGCRLVGIDRRAGSIWMWLGLLLTIPVRRRRSD